MGDRYIGGEMPSFGGENSEIFDVLKKASKMGGNEGRCDEEGQSAYR